MFQLRYPASSWWHLSDAPPHFNTLHGRSLRSVLTAQARAEEERSQASRSRERELPSQTRERSQDGARSPSRSRTERL